MLQAAVLRSALVQLTAALQPWPAQDGLWDAFHDIHMGECAGEALGWVIALLLGLASGVCDCTASMHVRHAPASPRSQPVLRLSALLPWCRDVRGAARH